MAQLNELDDPGYCPFLFPVVADRLWMRPIGVYCHRPGRAVRIPATSTLARCCAGQYRLCDSYSEMWADSLAGDSNYWLSAR